jgi:hypothetical protein
MIFNIVFFVLGTVAGAVAWSVIIMRDENVLTLADDEVVIKKPIDGHVLVQVPPSVARKLVQTNGLEEATGAPKTEARYIYADRALRARQIADRTENRLT